MGDLFDAEKFFRWNPATQRYQPLLWRRAILPAWLTVAETDQQYHYQLAAYPAVGRPLHIQPELGSAQGADQGLGSPFEIRKLVFCDSTVGTAAAAFTVKLRDQGAGRDLTSRRMHIRNVAGTAQLPFRMLEPYFLPSRSALQLEFQNLGAATYIRFFLHGANYYPWAPGINPGDQDTIKTLIRRWLNRRDCITPYWMGLEADDFIALPRSSNATYYMKNGEDGHFEALALMAVADGDFALQMKEVSTGGTVANGYVSQLNGIGNATLPFFFPAPWLIPAGMRIKLDFTDLSGLSVNNIWICMYGRRIYAPLKDVREVLRSTVVDVPADAGRVEVPPPLAYA
jgi:hypothetical protein